MAHTTPEPVPFARDEGLVNPDPNPVPQDTVDVTDADEVYAPDADQPEAAPAEEHPDDAEPLKVAAPEADTSGDDEDDDEAELPPMPEGRD